MYSCLVGYIVCIHVRDCFSRELFQFVRIVSQMPSIQNSSRCAKRNLLLVSKSVCCIPFLEILLVCNIIMVVVIVVAVMAVVVGSSKTSS